MKEAKTNLLVYCDNWYIIEAEESEYDNIWEALYMEREYRRGNL